MSSAFDKLARPVQKWIRQQGWRELRDIQARSIRTICETNTDLIVAASTAGGKTEAAFLPLISQVLDEPSDGTGFDLLYIGPLKALITDQAMRLEGMCQEAELPVIPWHGDVSQSVKTRALKSPKGILLITPESLEALLIRRGLEIPRLFGATRAVVIDELHTVLDSERGVQLRSLLTRLELAIKRPVRRIGLSATLGDMDLAKAYLRPDAASSVQLIEANGGEAELKLQLRGYLSGDEDDNSPSATDAIAAHLFKHLRGSDNLVFAGARQRVEIYADRLRELCEREHLPQEFYPHHASLSREHRDFVERRLKDPARPTTAVCTSTLELGIDIGDVTCVAQIGAPFSVAALRQRLGRSGRREGQPAILRQYAVEAKLTPESSFVDRLRLGLIRSIAMIDLLLEGWCEPPKPQALHLSTLVHQILSVIAQRGGASASVVYNVLCREGPFRKVTTGVFADVLRAIGHPETGLIEQSGSGLLLLGPTGEKLVEHYSFYAVFQTPEEFRLVAEGRDLGTLPIDNVLAPGMLLIFSGRRWVVQEIHDLEKVIVVKPAKAGVPPVFGGDAGDIHDEVIDRMFTVLEGDISPPYMEPVSLAMLDEARAHYERLGFRTKNIHSLGEHASIIATRAGTVKTSTLALALRSMGFLVEQHDGFLMVQTGDETPDLRSVLADIRSGEPVDLFAGAGNFMSEKFHPYLSKPLLELDAASSKLVPQILPTLVERIIQA
ncbi:MULTISPECIES: DEAD/DEAH box helicase [Rhodobacterales]|jgi:ATP-dependent helicase Lhr and Lhr-like helicase|uniref:ATP-dependent helicase n=5 Tax=Alphaproteobacteria TaxID=28211 RepID=A0A8J2ZNK1_9RHOB|nr:MULTISPECIES: DEAD/DEAH box helicase [Rhodobacterales]KGM46856.1 ATP-dependent helicase [Pseudooceanicola atlanticus]MBK1636699.1 ATP-dependent helicase [Rhodovulum adriaticum]MZR15527.1 DEAD/DEAH box helicase [Maritimibacter harenae]OAO03623.1 ATP-dependent helicase [Roseovarius indicus]GGG86545.1 ATP-dependent helicase [Salipiger pallidus]